MDNFEELKKRRELFEYKGIKVFIDLSLLTALNGKRAIKEKNEKEFGNLIFLLSIFSILINLFLLFIEGELLLINILNPKTLLQLLPTLMLLGVLSGLYFKRDKNLIDNTRIKLSLENIRTDIEKRLNNNYLINDFIDYQATLILNSSLIDLNSNFIKDISLKLLSDSNIKNILTTRLGIAPNELVSKLDGFRGETAVNGYIDFFTRIFNESMVLNLKNINKYSIFFVLIKFYLRDYLWDYKITDVELDGVRKWFINENQKREYFNKWKLLSKLKPSGDVNLSYTSKGTPTLDSLGEDLTNNKSSRDFVVSIGRDDEMRRLVTLLERETYTAVMLLGDSGTGKTRFIKYLATKMVVEDMPQALREYRLVLVNFNKLFSEKEDINDLKGTIIKIFSEIQSSGNIILVLEKFSSIFSFREEIKSELVSLIVDLLNKTKIKIIASDNFANFQTYIKPYRELVSKFDILEFKEADPQVALQILADESEAISKKYSIEIGFSALKRIIDYSYRFDYEKLMPQKGIDILLENVIEVKSKKLNYLDSSAIEEYLKMKLGVSVGAVKRDESEILMSLETNLSNQVIGQDEAISSIVSAIKRNRGGLNNKNRPVASFLFYGPTGVGKTELAKSLALNYYGSDKFMVRINMSEYSEEENLRRLIGYLNEEGEFVGGFLSEAVRARPFSLILLDEIEKANPKVLDLFLQVLDDGFLIDSLSRRVDFTNTIIIMTSNTASKEIEKLYKERKSYTEIKEVSMEVLKQNFRLEFLNRFDKIVLFRHLTIIEVSKVVEKFLREINIKLSERGIVLNWDSDTLSKLSQLGYDLSFGARELRRVVQENIEDKIADRIITGNIKDGSNVTLKGLDIVSEG